jgi:flagellar hook-basal body complex protein FliE
MDAIGPTVVSEGLRGEVAPTPLTSERLGGEVGGSTGPSFAQELQGAIGAADSLQRSADAQVDLVAQGQGNLHEAAIAIEKADISMHLLMNVRNKILSAYQDIVKMSI